MPGCPCLLLLPPSVTLHVMGGLVAGGGGSRGFEHWGLGFVLLQPPPVWDPPLMGPESYGGWNAGGEGGGAHDDEQPYTPENPNQLHCIGKP